MSGNEDFNDWLQAYAYAWDRPGREAIEAAVWKDYGMEGAVFVLDMTGFSRLTAQFGALHYLSMVRRMQIAAKAIIRRTNGELVKFEAITASPALKQSMMPFRLDYCCTRTSPC